MMQLISINLVIGIEYVRSGLILRMNSGTVKPLDRRDKHEANGLEGRPAGKHFYSIVTPSIV